MSQTYLNVTEEAGRDLFSRPYDGEVVMLNLLRFREIADYSATPDQAPEPAISGREAYQRYMDEMLPLLRRSGGDVLLLGNAGKFLIGPSDERWDCVMLVRQTSLRTFLQFASEESSLSALAHRTAALADSRLLPLVQRERDPGSGRFELGSDHENPLSG